ncbi:hypothetical protein [Absidia glauca]|uniref:Uncharacterized protein n=1 Tax=Absidia glauca TaxID=4829 RepID=A0A163J7R0_ABSGL|nr:hypothetical protein [Absidia glauca]
MLYKSFGNTPPSSPSLFKSPATDYLDGNTTYIGADPGVKTVASSASLGSKLLKQPLLHQHQDEYRLFKQCCQINPILKLAMLKVDQSRLGGLPGGKPCHCESHLPKAYACLSIRWKLSACLSSSIVTHQPPYLQTMDLLLANHHTGAGTPWPFGAITVPDLARPSGPCSH